jgi:hypothetical protein
MNKLEISIVFANADKNIRKNRLRAVERFMTKKVIAMAVSEVVGSFA